MPIDKTKNEIKNFPAGREMDILIAENVMGQTDFEHPGFLWTEGWAEDGSDGWNGFYCPRCNEQELTKRTMKRENNKKCVKNYSTSHKALEIIECEESLGFWQIWEGHPDGKWTATIYFDQVIIAEASAETIPLAICRAALLAVKEYKEHGSS